jgi:hypothetical protein
MARGFPPWHTIVVTWLCCGMLTFCVMSMLANVTIEVNGRRWQLVKSLAKSGPDDRHFVLKTTGDSATVIFGDGEHGTAPPTGSTVQATYRQGSGKAGEIKLNYRVSASRTQDQALWVVVRNGTKTISFERHRRFRPK